MEEGRFLLLCALRVRAHFCFGGIVKMKTGKIRLITATAMLSAIATGLMFLDFSVPIMPSFIKLDVSELPALIAGFAYGPISGICVCLIKNLFNLLHTSTGGVGELCNFLLGVFFIVPSALIYKFKKTRGGAALGSLIGAICMAVLSLPLNYFVTYPIYENFMPIEAIVNAYQDIAANVFGVKSELPGLFACLLFFNVPFTFLKGLLDALICFIIYKPLSPVLHGRR